MLWVSEWYFDVHQGELPFGGGVDICEFVLFLDAAVEDERGEVVVEGDPLYLGVEDVSLDLG